MSDFFMEALNAVSGAEWEEIPVGIEEFVTSEDFLNFPPLSEHQYAAIKAGTQIYREDTLIALYGEEEGAKRFNETCTEVCLMWGKGSTSPKTPVYNAETGNWQRIDSLNKEDNTVVGYTEGELKHEYATESFLEGMGEMLNVRTRLGFEEEVYVEHKFYAWKKKDFFKRKNKSFNGPDWVKAQDLEVGDKIAIAMGFDVAEPENISFAEARILGSIVGDGCCGADHLPQTNVDFGGDERESLEKYLQACDDFGCDYIVTPHPKKNMSYVRHRKNSKIGDLLRETNLWGKRAHDKRIPDVVWKSDNAVLKEFISSLWSADGTVYLKKTNSSTAPTAEYCTISEGLAHDVQRALLRLGIPSGLRSRIPSYTYKGEKRQGQRAYYVTVNGTDSFLRFANSITVLDVKAEKVKKGLALIENSRYRQSMNHDGLYWDAVVAIEDAGWGEYWTLTQPNSSNYVADGILSHQSGKDACSVIMCVYVAYLLMCLKDPARYYGKPQGDNIDIMNIAVNAQQANRVFFKNLVLRVEQCPWFEGKYVVKQGEVNFDKNINVISGHSESESLEGYNVIMVVLDEISGFALESASGNDRAKTAGFIYDMHRGSVDSRFDEFGKVVLLSFSRFKGDFISQKYESAIAEREVIVRSHTFKLNEDLPDGIHGNELTIEWNEDHITRYAVPGYFALKRPTWEVNPIKSLDGLKRAFFTNTADALGRFACEPSDNTEDSFIKNKQAIEESFIARNGVDNYGVFAPNFKPDSQAEYYIHVDLSKVHDRCAVAMAHVDKWVTTGVGLGEQNLPVVRVDAVRWWKPSKDKPMDYKEVTDYILKLKKHGFNIKLVTFDRWQSNDTMNYLENHHVKTSMLSVGNTHYDDFLSVLYDQRLVGPKLEELIEELRQLRYIKGKIDHPRSGYKDLSDATCGAIFNAIAHTTKPEHKEVEVVTYKRLMREQAREQQPSGLIKPPRQPMPEDLREELDQINVEAIRLI